MGSSDAGHNIIIIQYFIMSGLLRCGGPEHWMDVLPCKYVVYGSTTITARGCRDRVPVML